MEKMMKKMFVAAVLSAIVSAAASAQGVKSDIEPAGVISYALPKTVLVFDVKAVRESFYAGPYARYAQKYLGVQARQKNEVTYHISEVSLTPCMEADQNSRYVVTLGKNVPSPTFLQMTAQGLVSVSDGSFGNKSVWRFPSADGADFSSRGVNSNLTSESTTLYQKTSSNKVSVQQSMIVEKTDEAKAQETAEMIFKLRKTRVQIVTGDTDANYSGAAMSAALEELGRLEQEYLSLFIGYSDYEIQEKSFDVVPENNPESRIAIAFRISEAEGLVPADNVEGKPYFLEINAQPVQETGDPKTAAKKGSGLMYRIPAICSLKLSDGVNTVLQGRVPVYQYGIDKQYAIQ